MKKAISTLLALSLTLTLALIPSSALSLDEAKQLLSDYYMDDIPEEILALDNLDAIFEALGDPYTYYMTPEQYEAFNKSVNGDSVVGIGATVERAFNGGYLVMSVLPDSPALEAGLRAGDILVAVDGMELTADTDPSVYIIGTAGTPVTITVVREGQRINFTITRREVPIPIITYEMVDGAAYIECVSFGDPTPDGFEAALTELEDQTSVWIVDLRSNPGGDSDATAVSASYFTGAGIMLYFRDGDGDYRYTYTLPGFPDLTDKPVIVLTSEHSASGSELFAGDIRSYEAGISLGQRSFGKGTAQIVLEERNCPYMVNGEAMKITAYRFFAPDGTTNYITGILPTLLISPENTEKAAFLLACGPSDYPENHMKLEIAGQTFCVNLFKAVEPENMPAFCELLEALPPSAQLYYGDGKGWNPITAAALADKLGLIAYNPRVLPDTADSPYAREIDTLTTYRILKGYNDGLFHPGDMVTRAQFCTMVATALDLPASDGQSGKFSDVEESSWYAGAVSAMASMGFIKGYGDGSFGPNDTVTCQEMAVILSRVAAWANMDGYDLDSQDLTIQEYVKFSGWAEWARISARNLDTLGALPDGISPAAPGSRETAAAMLCRLMENIHLIWD